MFHSQLYSDISPRQASPLVVWGLAHYPELLLSSVYSQQIHKWLTSSWYFCTYRTQHYWTWQKMVPIFHFNSHVTNARIITCNSYYDPQAALRLIWMKNTVFWDMMPYGLAEVHQHLRRTHWSKFLQPTSCWLFNSLTLSPWKCRQYVPPKILVNYRATVSHPRIQHSSWTSLWKPQIQQKLTEFKEM